MVVATYNRRVSDDIQTSVGGRGGYREGAGRPIGAKDRGPRLTGKEFSKRMARLESLGVLQGTARRVLESIGGDGYWLRVIDRLESADNWEKIASLMQFLLQMRDGRPAQQINVTSIGVKFSADEIARAREIARELIPSHTLDNKPPRADAAPAEVTKTHLLSEGVSDEPFAGRSRRTDGEDSIMVSAKAGGKSDGM
jgi:hypothetical protein